MPEIIHRMLRKGFWCDGELLRWSLAKRVLYCAGLPAIADFTGCVEDDVWAWKVQLFPSPVDAAVTPEALKGWRDELVAAGKLIPYEHEGKDYLYQPSFHRHQHLTNVGRPRLPWPREHLAIRPHRTDSRKCVIYCAQTGEQLQPTNANGRPITTPTVGEPSVESSEDEVRSAETSAHPPAVGTTGPRLGQDNDNRPHIPRDEEYGRLLGDVEHLRLGVVGPAEHASLVTLLKAYGYPMLQEALVQTAMNESSKRSWPAYVRSVCERLYAEGWKPY